MHSSKNNRAWSPTNDRGYESEGPMTPTSLAAAANAKARELADEAAYKTAKATRAYLGRVRDVQERVDAVPWERFPFCCASSNAFAVDADVSLSKLKPVRQRKQ